MVSSCVVSDPKVINLKQIVLLWSVLLEWSAVRSAGQIQSFSSHPQAIVVSLAAWARTSPHPHRGMELDRCFLLAAHPCKLSSRSACFEISAKIFTQECMKPAPAILFSIRWLDLSFFFWYHFFFCPLPLLPRTGKHSHWSFPLRLCFYLHLLCEAVWSSGSNWNRYFSFNSLYGFIQTPFWLFPLCIPNRCWIMRCSLSQNSVGVIWHH